MSACVLDASSVFPWLFQDEASGEADALLALVCREGAVVPSLWPVEIANGLGMAERRNRLSRTELSNAVGLLQGLPLVVEEAPPARMFGVVLHLMRVHALTAYDAVYLELAIRTGLPLATNDQDLRNAAAAAGMSSPKAPAPSLSST